MQTDIKLPRQGFRRRVAAAAAETNSFFRRNCIAAASDCIPQNNYVLVGSSDERFSL